MVRVESKAGARWNEVMEYEKSFGDGARNVRIRSSATGASGTSIPGTSNGILIAKVPSLEA